MEAPLNFGPSEQTREQRRLIADRALTIVRLNKATLSRQLVELYEKYVEGEVDLYAISVLVKEEKVQC